MGVSFDGPGRLIIATAGTTALSAVDIYSRWKDWLASGDNAKYLQAFSIVGGDPIGGGNSITPYVFLENGWRLRPQEADHELIIDGNLVVQGGGNPIVPTLGSFRVTVVRQLALKTETVETGVSGLTPAEAAQLSLIQTILDLVQADEVHTGTQVIKRLRGTATAILTKNHAGTPLQNLQITE